MCVIVMRTCGCQGEKIHCFYAIVCVCVCVCMHACICVHVRVCMCVFCSAGNETAFVVILCDKNCSAIVFK